MAFQQPALPSANGAPESKGPTSRTLTRPTWAKQIPATSLGRGTSPATTPARGISQQEEQQDHIDGQCQSTPQGGDEDYTKSRTRDNHQTAGGRHRPRKSCSFVLTWFSVVTFETAPVRHVLGVDAGRRHDAERAPTGADRLLQFGRAAVRSLAGSRGILARPWREADGLLSCF
ncbi:hypothetical protein Bbelb_276220 [Branchiostoma belcheri]|nr:hypothetical protein Bbelb_276220 [Branchiostoma belcheri]